MSSLAVFDIEHGTASSVRSLEDHSVNRTEDGWSAIDTSRSHLNRTLVGANRCLSNMLSADFMRRL